MTLSTANDAGAAFMIFCCKFKIGPYSQLHQRHLKALGSDLKCCDNYIAGQ